MSAKIPLRPPITNNPQNMKRKKLQVDNDSSEDEDMIKAKEKTKKYMEAYNANRNLPQPKSFRPNRGGRPGMNKNVNLPPNYICHRCRQKGHLIQDCPTNGNTDFDLKKAPKGMPKNLKKENLPEEVEDKFIKTLLNNEISYDRKAQLSIMPEFQCLICEDIFNDPYLVPC